MNSVVNIRKDVDVVKRALRLREPDLQQQKSLKLLKDYEEALTKATEGMTLEEKTRLEHETAKKCAEWYAKEFTPNYLKYGDKYLQEGLQK